MKIRRNTEVTDADWLELRAEFFPEDYAGEHLAFLAAMAGQSNGFTAFIAHDKSGRAVGFAEVSIRHEYVNGCKHRPALFLEGIFVKPEARGRGIARALCDAAADFGTQQGCREFASDVFADDDDSLAAHVSLGFAETERVVYFRKLLKPSVSNAEES